MPVDGHNRLVVAGVFLAVFVYDGVLRRLLAGVVALPGIPRAPNSLSVILLLFSLWHASVALGVRLALAFFAITRSRPGPSRRPASSRGSSTARTTTPVSYTH